MVAVMVVVSEVVPVWEASWIEQKLYRDEFPLTTTAMAAEHL
jgi:hypothetical protein